MIDYAGVIFLSKLKVSLYFVTNEMNEKSRYTVVDVDFPINVCKQNVYV